MKAPQQVLNTLAMLGLDCKCMVDIFKKFYADMPNCMREPVRYGITNGYQTFIATNILQEFSTIAYGALNTIEEQHGELQDLRQEYDSDFFIHLGKVRNSMHIYNKFGSYENKAKRIIESINDQFPFNYNISLFYRIKGNRAFLLGTNVFYIT